MMNFRKSIVAGALLLLGAAGCVDLDVTNPNEPDADRALAQAGDVEALVSGAFSQWWLASNAYDGISLALSTMSFQHMSSAANSGMVDYAALPRQPVINDAAATYYPNFAYPWTRHYRALSAVARGLGALEAKPELVTQLGPERAARIRAFGKLIQGLSTAGVAILYDQGIVMDETIDVNEPQEPVSYQEMMQKALGYFDEAIAIASSANFTVPAGWSSTEMSSAQMVRIARSMKARYRAEVARTPAERAAVDWNAVRADAQAGLTSDWMIDVDYAYGNWTSNIYHLYAGQTGSWSFLNYFIYGMADQSGSYQKWLQVPLADRRPDLPGGTPFLIMTPDKRFPQGASIDAQKASPGKYIQLPTFNITSQWARPERGTWRWSYYRLIRLDSWINEVSPLWPEFRALEGKYLIAEADYRAGNLASAATIINETRLANGLSATDAAGTNTSCVPKLPDGSCGGLFEMLKWEKRMELMQQGAMSAPWYFDNRGWGDLYKGTVLHFPMPALELELLGKPSYSFGGSGGGSAAVSTYKWPGE